MNTKYKILFITFLCLTIGISACKEDKKILESQKATKKIVKAKAEQKETVEIIVQKKS